MYVKYSKETHFQPMNKRDLTSFFRSLILSKVHFHKIALHYAEPILLRKIRVLGHLCLRHVKTGLSRFLRGGERGIRTLDAPKDIPPFQGGALGHYATSPCFHSIPIFRRDDAYS